MSSVVRFNPQSQSFVSNGTVGKFENRPVSRQGIVKNLPAQQPGPQVLSAGKPVSQPVVQVIS
ncbi:hypothetical protein Dtox_4233 [Desulfofarcimen acetoxidans DSM 771]|uniref:Uncharacterized protein n=1 Tax=Desulfofarcimen acetoxidans (strain ATCC 49208 / DSM 771 / KCTC 5769 / VKM B-1644 / 5575) TaxID=485916 RepID=C8VZF5_DESAS|nr:hypothetical protein [Desulfofarcimen acetoxidans]ACV64900.1 hypothetical protein Dtox_4233 [Desulfofarcimen acetoxidans DSM 771]